MKKSRTLLLLSTVCLAASGYAGPMVDNSKDKKEMVMPPPEPKFYLSLSAGGEFDIHATKFISNGGGDLGFGGVSLPTKVQSRDFTAAHDPGVINGQLEAGYKITPDFAVFLGFTYSHADGDEHGVGRVSDPGGVFGNSGGKYELNVDVSQYQAYTGRAGFKLTIPRYVLNLIHAPTSITPYLSASAGGKYIESQRARFSAGNFVDRGLELYEDSWVFTANATLGYNWQLSRNFALIFESGYGYDTKPERGDRLSGVTGVNDGGDRLYSTVSLGGKVLF